MEKQTNQKTLNDLDLVFVHNKLGKNELYSIDGVPVPSFESDKIEFLDEYLKEPFTKSDWEKYLLPDLAPGRRVSDEILDTLLESIPPKTMNNNYFQHGEVYTHDEAGTPFYYTFYYTNSHEPVYLGLFPKENLNQSLRVRGNCES